jgi:hypothetical protein
VWLLLLLGLLLQQAFHDGAASSNGRQKPCSSGTPATTGEDEWWQWHKTSKHMLCLHAYMMQHGFRVDLSASGVALLWQNQAKGDNVLLGCATLT